MQQCPYSLIFYSVDSVEINFHKGMKTAYVKFTNEGMTHPHPNEFEHLLCVLSHCN